MVIVMKNDKWVIQPFNGTYKAVALFALLFTAGLCRVLGAMETERAMRSVLHLSGSLTAFLLIYRFLLLFDREYAEAAYPEGKINVWNELLFYPCNVIAIVGFAGLLLSSRLLLSFAVFCSVCPVAALLFPPLGYEKYSITVPRIWAFYLYHYMILTVAAVMVSTRIYVPEYADIIPAIKLYAEMSFVFLLLNYILVYTGANDKANYFFNRIPEENAIMELLYRCIPVPYLFTMPLLAIAGLINCVLVWMIHLMI